MAAAYMYDATYTRKSWEKVNFQMTYIRKNKVFEFLKKDCLYRELIVNKNKII